MTSDGILGLAFFLFGCLTLVCSAELPKSLLGGEVGPAFFPKVWAGALALLGAMLFLVNLLKSRNKESRGQAKACFDTFWKNHRQVIFSFLLTGLYIFSMKWLGFLLSTSLFTPACIFMLEGKATKKLSLLTILITVGLAGIPYLFFTRVMQIILPTAPWYSLREYSQHVTCR